MDSLLCPVHSLFVGIRGLGKSYLTDIGSPRLSGLIWQGSSNLADDKALLFIKTIINKLFRLWCGPRYKQEKSKRTEQRVQKPRQLVGCGFFLVLTGPLSQVSSSRIDTLDDARNTTRKLKIMAVEADLGGGCPGYGAANETGTAQEV